MLDLSKEQPAVVLDPGVIPEQIQKRITHVILPPGIIAPPWWLRELKKLTHLQAPGFAGESFDASHCKSLRYLGLHKPTGLRTVRAARAVKVNCR